LRAAKLVIYGYSLLQGLKVEKLESFLNERLKPERMILTLQPSNFSTLQQLAKHISPIFNKFARYIDLIWKPIYPTLYLYC